MADEIVDRYSPKDKLFYIRSFVSRFGCVVEFEDHTDYQDPNHTIHIRLNGVGIRYNSKDPLTTPPDSNGSHFNCLSVTKKSKDEAVCMMYDWIKKLEQNKFRINVDGVGIPTLVSG